MPPSHTPVNYVAMSRATMKWMMTKCVDSYLLEHLACPLILRLGASNYHIPAVIKQTAKLGVEKQCSRRNEAQRMPKINQQQRCLLRLEMHAQVLKESNQVASIGVVLDIEYSGRDKAYLIPGKR